jgi:hypothetical protein
LLYYSLLGGGDSGAIDWIPREAKRHTLSYRIFVVCQTQHATRVADLVTRLLKTRGATVQASSMPTVSKKGSAVRMAFAVRGSPEVRGAIAAMVNQLSADQGVRAVRWESDPHPQDA